MFSVLLLLSNPWHASVFFCIFSYNDTVPIIRLAHLQCESILFWSSCMSSVCLSRIRPWKLSKTDAKFHHIYRKSGSLSTNMMSDFAPEIAKYHKSSPNPPNSVWVYCLAPLWCSLFLWPLWLQHHAIIFLHDLFINFLFFIFDDGSSCAQCIMHAGI